MTTSSNTDNNVSFLVKVAGSTLPETIRILSISIEKHINKIAQAKIVILDGTPNTETFEVSSSPIFEAGAELTIEAGYDNNNSQIFQGIITQQSIRIEKLLRSTLTIECLGETLENIPANSTTDTNSVLTITYGDNLYALNADLNLKLSEVVGQVKVQGTSLTEPGKFITLKGLGSRFSGDQFIAGVQHQFEAGNWLTDISFGLNHEVQNSNSTLQSDDSIYIKSLKDITIDAEQSIYLKANAGIHIIASGGNVEISGLNIHETAQLQYTAEGNATTSISAGVELTLKSPMIMIN